MTKIWNLLACAVACIPLHALAWPEKTVTIVVPGAPGTAVDTLARKVGERLQEKYGQPVVVENKVGAGGLIAYEAVARQKADGHSLAMVAGGFAIAPVLYKNLPVDPLRDLTPIAQLALIPMVFATRPEAPFRTLRDVETAAKSGQKLSYSTGGNGSTAHLVAESFKQMAGIDMTHVPFRSSALAVPDVVSGRVDIGMLDSVTAIPLITGGRLKALAIASPSRVPALPNVPTAAEAGLAFTAVGWVGLFGPSKLPPEVTEKINAAANEAMASSSLRDVLAQSGSIAVSPALNAAQWKSRFEDYVQTWGKVARDAGMKAE